MIIAFSLLWVPYISGIGGLLALIGVVFLWLGRHGFTSVHRTNVNLGAGCVVLGILIGIGVGIWFVSAILSAGTMPQQSLNAIGPLLQSDLGILFLVGVVAGALSAFAYTILPFALADRQSRVLLIAGGILTVLVLAVQFSILFPQISNAVSQATSGGMINTGPVTSLQTESSLIATSQILPDIMFAWAYFRIRTRMFPRELPSVDPN
ncbi:MAG: hypothetical protein L3K02_03330 [Thermoplasmata archaeon]|nr:hypothetical protein [Thermoplasmata archaeon]